MKHDDAKLKLYLTHRTALIDYATPIVGCRTRAEDLVQEAYLRFAPVQKAERPGEQRAEQRIEQPVSYLYRIVRNLALDWKRHVSAEGRRDRAHRVVLDPIPTAPSPEEQAMHRDELRRVEAALAELPDRVRLVFEMHRLGGFTFQQIAARLDVSVATAARWAQHALLHITKRLQDQED